MQVARRLLMRGETVVGIDDLNGYYDVNLKQARLEVLKGYPNFKFACASIANPQAVAEVFASEKPMMVINLAAQAGVRHSFSNPLAFMESNVLGFSYVLEECRKQGVLHIVYASSSSVYGANAKVPFQVSDAVDQPLSVYAATKKTNELMAHAYSHLYGLPTTGLRYFTAYGPWGRPDMFPWLLTQAILDGQTVNVFNHGKVQRDFTFIDDIVEATVRVLDHIPNGQTWGSSPAGSSVPLDAPYRIYNVGRQEPVELIEFIEILESELGRKARKNFLPLPPGDMPVTCADVSELSRDLGFVPCIALQEGLPQWVSWFRKWRAT